MVFYQCNRKEPVQHIQNKTVGRVVRGPKEGNFLQWGRDAMVTVALGS
ncbi:hypothetical protein LEMLEM_LOCUS24872 [Lemmus lemmus]